MVRIPERDEQIADQVDEIALPRGANVE